MKNKFALCFRPVVTEAETEEIGGDIIVGKVRKRNGTTLPPSMSPSVMKNSGGSRVQIPSFARHKNHSRKALSRVLKTILLESSPKMRVGGGKIREIEFPEETNDLQERKIDEGNKIFPSCSSSSSYSSRSSSSSSSTSDKSSAQDDLKPVSMKRSLARSRSNPSSDKKKKAKITKTNDKASDSSLSLLSSNICEDHKDTVLYYWVFLALLATIFWGKMFAILIATLWLYYINPRRSTGLSDQKIQPEFKSIKVPEVTEATSTITREYRKKVIMEGLLER